MGWCPKSGFENWHYIILVSFELIILERLHRHSFSRVLRFVLRVVSENMVALVMLTASTAFQQCNLVQIRVGRLFTIFALSRIVIPILGIGLNLSPALRCIPMSGIFRGKRIGSQRSRKGESEPSKHLIARAFCNEKSLFG